MTPWRQRPRGGDDQSIIEVLYAGPVPTVALRSFAVWVAERTWHLVGPSSDYDLDTSACLRFARALNVAHRAAFGRAGSPELMAAWIDALDQRSAKTGWWPERLASRGAFGAAARMAARFACRATCHPDATVAALTSSWSTGWAVGYLAANRGGGQELRLAATEPASASSGARW